MFWLKTRFFPDSSTELLGARIGRTKVLLGGTTLLDNLDKAGLELLNGGNVVGEDTHLTGGGGDVDLGPVVAKFVSIQGDVGMSARWKVTHTPVER